MANYPSIRIEGGLLGPDVLEQLIAGDLPGQRPVDFGLRDRRSLTDEIAAAFADARALWGVFQRRLERVPAADLATTVTRDAWMIPFLGLLGYEPKFNAKGREVDGLTFAISHRAGEADDTPPLHIVGIRQELGRVPASGRPRLAPHSLLQEYLNRTEHVWGLVANGRTLRVLRDCTFVRRQAYIEFDLPAILEEQRFQDFAVLYRLLHRTRFPQGINDSGECLLEQYYARSIEQGGRVREHLRDGVEECLKLLGDGFLAHPANEQLRRRVSSDCPEFEKLTGDQLYRQLLTLVYRLLFLLVSEDRGLLSADATYRQHYSISRLRRLLGQRASFTDHDDLWQTLRVLWLVLVKDQPQPALGNQPMASSLGLPVLNGDLFAPQLLDECTISNSDLLSALWRLTWYQESRNSPPRHVNYAALDVEELGSVYESLLEFHPAIDTDARGRPTFNLLAGSERKTTGSYYTPPELVAELIKSALEPVLAERLKRCANVQTSEKAILSIRVCDPACGSGHFLLAAARRMGKELARVRTGEDEPSPERVREAIRDVVSHCIYGVDRNPLAVDLCRVALWLESHTTDKPLTFLDHRIRCGDSLVGVFDLSVLQNGIPDKAFDGCKGDDKTAARAAAKQNREERRGARDLFAERDSHNTATLSRHSRDVDTIPDDSPEHIRRKKELFEASHRDPAWLLKKQASDLWTAAFFQTLLADSVAITTATLADHRNGKPINAQLLSRAEALSHRQPFFHWPLEFPEVFAAGGFDILLSNPPWERIKLQEQEFFAARDSRIATAANKAARARLIVELTQQNPMLHAEFIAAIHDADCVSKFLRQSDRFTLTAKGDINTYAVFAETIRRLLCTQGRAGIILPTGVATSDTCKSFFADLTENKQLVSLMSFLEIRDFFLATDSREPFCLLTLSGQAHVEPQFAFSLLKVEQIRDSRRCFTLTSDDFLRFSPNTRTCPIFRTSADTELTRKIYSRAPVLIQETQQGGNPWGLSFMRMFDMANDSRLFHNTSDIGLVPLWEAKLMHQFNHRFATYEANGETRDTTIEEKADPTYCAMPRYWVSEAEILNRLAPPTHEEQTSLADGSLSIAELQHHQRERAPKWLLCYRDICRTNDERTAILGILPRVAVGHKAPVFVLPPGTATVLQLCLAANFNSLAFDFVVRQKFVGTSLTYFVLKQIPILPPTFYRLADVTYVASRVFELIYTADDMQPLADAVRKSDTPLAASMPSRPYRWDETRRALLRAELDAWFARAYGLTRDELRYILDPADVFGPDFPGETFRVLKEKETAKYGEYRTRRLVLEAWDRLPPTSSNSANGQEGTQ